MWRHTSVTKLQDTYQCIVQYDAGTVIPRVLRLVAVASILAFALTARAVTAAHAAGEDVIIDTASGDSTETATATLQVTSTEVVEEPVVAEPVVEEPVVEPSLPPAEADEPADATAEEPPPSDTTSGGGSASKPSAPAGNPNGPVPSHAPVAQAPPDAGTETEPLPDGEAPPEAEAPPTDTELEPDVIVDPAPAGETGSGTESAVDSGSQPAPSPDLPPTGTVAGPPTEPLPAGPPAVDSAPLHDPLAEPVVAGGPPADAVDAPGGDIAPEAGAAVMPHTASASAGPGAAAAPASAEGTTSTTTAVVEAVRAVAGPSSAKPVPVEASSHRSRHADEPAAIDPAAAAGAGLAAGIAVVNRAPSASVAVAIEFGRAGGGWAGAIVFNLWLRRQLRERRMSQRQLAALSGVDHSTISRLLRQDRRPSLSTATKLVAALRHVGSEQADVAAADYFERMPEETIFPARRVELALRADDQLDDDQVRRLMTLYLDARRRHAAAAQSPPGTTIRSAAGRDRR